MPARQFAPGFRFSMLDMLILVVATGAMIFVSQIGLRFAAPIAFVVVHFFLFCNVIRMSRALELIWAFHFLALAAATAIFSLPGWPSTYLLCLLVTVIAVSIEMTRPSYHGVGWKRINPRLPDWWEEYNATS